MSTTGYIMHANAADGGMIGKNLMFYHVGKWWAVLKDTVDSDYKLWESDGTIPASPGDTGGWARAGLTGGGDVEFHSSNSAQGAVWMDSANNRLHTYFQIGSATNLARYNRFVYIPSTGLWTNEVPDEDPGTMPDDSVHGGEKLGIVVDSNEVCWLIYYHNANDTIECKYRTIAGSWTAGPDLRTLSDGTEAGQSNSAVSVVKWQNAGSDSIGVFFAWDTDYGFMYRDDGDALSTAWTYELAYDTSTDPAIGSVENKHAAVAYLSEAETTSRIVVAMKDGSASDIYGGYRSANGRWKALAKAGLDATPHTDIGLIVDETNEELYVFYVHQTAAEQKQLWYDKSSIAPMSFRGTDTTIIEDPTPVTGGGGPGVPHHAVTSEMNLRVMADFDATNQGWNEISIFPVAAKVPITLTMIRKPWTKQPPAGTQIDWSYPLTKGLLTAIPFNDPGKQTVRAQTRKLGDDIGTNPGTNPWSWSGHGAASVLRPATPAISNALDFDIDTASPTSGLSVYWLGEFLYDDAMPDSQDIWFIADTETSGDGWRLTKGNTAIGMSANEFRFRTGDLTNTNRDTTFSWEIGDLFSMLWTWGGSNKRIYRDGVQVDSVAATGTLTYSASTMRVGNTTTGLSYENASGYQLLLVYDRALTPAEAMSLHKNPWQIFEPRKVFVDLTPKAQRLVVF